MSRSIQLVHQFHETFQQHVSPAPTTHQGTEQGQRILESCATALKEMRGYLRSVSAADVRCHRMALETEELSELADAMARHDLIGILDAQVDKRYVADGTTVTFGLQHVFDEAFEEVHSSNMSKLGEDGKPVYDQAGKVVKGPGYRPPNLRPLLKAKRTQDSELITKVKRACAKRFHLHQEDLDSKVKLPTVVKARRVCMYVLRNMLNMSSTEIGNVVGGRDHSTVLEALIRVSENPVLLGVAEELMRELKP